jgi:hypothetical protein
MLMMGKGLSDVKGLIDSVRNQMTDHPGLRPPLLIEEGTPIPKPGAVLSRCLKQDEAPLLNEEGWPKAGVVSLSGAGCRSTWLSPDGNRRERPKGTRRNRKRIKWRFR